MRTHFWSRQLTGGVMLALSSLTVSATPMTSPALPYDDVFVFGDSLADSGNLFALTGETTPVPFGDVVPLSAYESERLSNGPVWVDHIGVIASLEGGNGYAFAGARTGPLPVVPFPDATPTLIEQLDAFFAAHATAPRDALYIVAGGGNDLRDAGFEFSRVFAEALAANAGDVEAAQVEATRAAQAVLGATIGNVAGIVSRLAAGGARDVVVWNAPDPVFAPVAAGLDPQTRALLSALAAGYNDALSFALAELAVAVPALDLATFDVAGLVADAVANPGQFGFEEAMASCVTPTSVCSNPDEYLFWDGLHPSAAAHVVLSDAFKASLDVATPATFALATAGLLYLVLVGSRRSRRAPRARAQPTFA